jgi:hypothetical protein
MGGIDRNRGQVRRDPQLTDPNPEADQAAMCGGKERFASGALAVRVASKRKYKGGGVYRCDYCNGFHLGRRTRRRAV